MYGGKTKIKLSPIIPVSFPFVKKKRGSKRCRGQKVFLLLAEGHAVGALVHGGVILMGTHQDAVQRAVVLGVAVIGAGLDGAFNALVGMAVHVRFLLPLV